MQDLSRRDFGAALASVSLLASQTSGGQRTGGKRKVYLVPNFHPASCGWLTTFSRERVYCANSYLNHLDRVRDDPQYEFVMSEVNNIIAIMNFRPERMPGLRNFVRQKRVELVNGYFLESTINLSGGEALLRLGVEGIRWDRQVFGVTPRFSWNIDVCGTHEQMPQIAAQLGLEALVYTRKNPTGQTLFWSVAPDGSKILTLCPGHYSEAQSIFNTKTLLDDQQLNELETFFENKEPKTPANAPILVLAGADDYALSPALNTCPSQFLADWRRVQPEREIRFSTLSKYLDAVQPGIDSGEISIPTTQAGTAYDFDAFWIENPEVKTRFRSSEHSLQAAEALATLASLEVGHSYPVEDFYGCWILLCLNMDRNTLWGSAGGMVFVDANSWDVNDRFNWIEHHTASAMQNSGKTLLGSGRSAGLFNPLNWRRNDPVVLRLPADTSLQDLPCEALPDGSALCRIDMPPVSAGAWNLSSRAPEQPRTIDLPERIETEHYSVRFDRTTGAISSLKLKSKGREMLASPVNVIVAERPSHRKPKNDPGDFMPPRPERTRLATSSDKPSKIKVSEGPIATTIEATGTFYGGGLIRRVTRFYHAHPRIDFETELNDIPNFTVVVAEFPLAENVIEIRRGIPFGFSHGGWTKPNPALHGWTKGIVPAVRWIDYSFDSGGFALFDRGCSGREIDGRTPLIYLLNAEDKYNGYPNAWLSGKGRHVLSYSAMFHGSPWIEARIPHVAWEYNQQPVHIAQTRAAAPKPYVETSGNVIMEALRREGDHIELRMVECLGLPASAWVELSLPHSAAVLTNALGHPIRELHKSARYEFPIRPQEIVTLQFRTAETLPTPDPIEAWDRFVPKEKLAALHAYDPNLIGHPPFGS